MNPQRKWLVFLAVGMMILLVNLDATIVNLALANIAKAFGVGMTEIQWVITSYLLVTAVSFCIFGRLADMLGKRRVYILGVVFFIAASLLAGLAPNVEMLILARFIQGLGFAATLGLSLILIVQAFPEQQRGFAMGAAITITGVAQAAGPIVGGVILELASWRWIFLLNVPLGLLSIIMTLKIVPRDEITRESSMDFFGAALFIAGFSFILVSVNQYTVLGKYYFILCCVIGGCLLSLFVVKSLKTKHPLIDLRLLKNQQYLNIVNIRMLFMFASSGLLFIIPLYLQNVLAMSPLRTGSLLLFMTAVIAVASPLIGKMVDFVSYKWPILISMITAVISCFILTQVSVSTQQNTLIAGLMLFGLAFGANIPATAAGVLVQAPKEAVGVAIGLFFTIGISGAMLGVAISSTIMDLHSQALLRQFLAVQHVSINPEQLKILSQAANGSQSQLALVKGLNSDLRILPMKEALAYSFLGAFHLIFYMMMSLSLLGVVLSCLLFRINKKPG